MAVRQSLYDFLQELSSDASWSSDTPLFIDQICIDQASSAERNQQVYQMSDVYRQASEVIVWLGPGDEESRSAVRAWRDGALGVDHFEWLELHLGQHRYWQRLWVVQEVLVAKSLILRWGSEKVDWDRLHVFLDATKDHQRFCNSKYRNMLYLIDGRERHQLNGSNKLNWTEALRISQGTFCEDTRDRVYGLLGLVNRSALKPDYAHTILQVWHDLLRYGIARLAESKQDYDWQAKWWAGELGISDDVDTPDFYDEPASKAPESLPHRQSHRESCTRDP